MTCLVTELLSPSQIGPASTRMSRGQHLLVERGHSSLAQPCSVMSGQTPVAMSWSTARISSTRDAVGGHDVFADGGQAVGVAGFR